MGLITHVRTIQCRARLCVGRKGCGGDALSASLEPYQNGAVFYLSNCLSRNRKPIFPSMRNREINYTNKILPCGLGWDRDTKSTAPPILFLQSPSCSGPQVFFHLARSLSIADERGRGQSITITRLIEGESTRKDNLLLCASPAFSAFPAVHAHSRGLLQEGDDSLG